MSIVPDKDAIFFFNLIYYLSNKAGDSVNDYSDHKPTLFLLDISGLLSTIENKKKIMFKLYVGSCYCFTNMQYIDFIIS